MICEEGTMVQQSTVETTIDVTCGTLLRDLKLIWDEVGESEVEREKVLLQLQQECVEVYRRKVDGAKDTRARQLQALARAEAEFFELLSVLGEPASSQREIRTGSLKDQISAIGPQLKELRQRKEERVRQFVEVKAEIAMVSEEIAGTQGEIKIPCEEDLTRSALNIYHGQLQALQREKSERLHRVKEYVNTMHQLCSVMGMNFSQIAAEVHPSLDDSQEVPKSICNDTLNGLVKTIHLLRAEKKKRLEKIKELGTLMSKFWSLMDTPVEERKAFQFVSCLVLANEVEIVCPSSLSKEIIKEAQTEVERLDMLKKSKMKELVLRKRLDLEEICNQAHLEPDVNTAADKLIAVIDSGVVDTAELLSKLEDETARVQNEVASRKDIMILMEKWMTACEEEGWLEDYNKDENRFNAKGAHLNLKRAEKARAAIAKLPAMVHLLMQRTKSWEEERGVPFMFDGVRLLCILNEYKKLREEREEEKRRLKNYKKVQDLAEKEALFGARASPAKSAPLSGKKMERSPRVSNIGVNGQNTASRRLYLSDAATQHTGVPE